MLVDKVKKLFARQEIPPDARELVRNATDMRDVLRGLDELITRNEMEVNNLTAEMEALESVEQGEVEKVREGSLPERSKNNVLRRIQRLRKQMDNLEERQRIYNRNINLQIELVGRIQALEAMELRGVDEDRIDSILAEYEEELTNYQSVLETEEIATGDLVSQLDDSDELAALEGELVGAEPAAPAPAVPAPVEKEDRSAAAPAQSSEEPSVAPTPAAPAKEKADGDAPATRGLESDR